MKKAATVVFFASLFLPVVLLGGCGDAFGFLNPAFVGTIAGGVYPVTPGPGADFVFVRVVNEIDQPAEFVVTIERAEPERDEEGSVTVDPATGLPITRRVLETLWLNTEPSAPANDFGVLFPCGESAIDRVGLGEDLQPTDIAVFVGGGGVAGSPGFGISAVSVPPLNRRPMTGPSNFNCGDTVIFRAIRNSNALGGVKLESFLLPGFEQPSVFASGTDTFVTYQEFLESQALEETEEP